MRPNLKLHNATLIISLVIMAACNKSLPDPEPIESQPPTGSSILKLLDAPEYSILKAAVTRAGKSMTTLLSDSTAVYTFFAPDNAAFQFSGIPNEAVIGFLSPG